MLDKVDYLCYRCRVTAKTSLTLKHELRRQ
jgi:hypothetical protein